MASTQAARSQYYIYRIAVGDGVYIGQAKSALRALDHLGSSSNKRLQEAISAAEFWPDVSVLILPKRCGGDLTIGEAAMIQVASLPGRECFNKTSSSVCGWEDAGDANPAEWSSSDPELFKCPAVNGITWKLRSEPFCHEANLEAVKKAARLVNTNKPFSKRFRFLPDPGATINRLTAPSLALRLAAAGHHSAFVVPINGRRSDDRITLGPDATDAGLADRCLKWWPPSKKTYGDVNSNPPTALIAVVGGPKFRIVAGAWALDTDKSDLTTGEFIASSKSADLASLQGSVLTMENFVQSRHPIWWIREGQQPTWVGHS